MQFNDIRINENVRANVDLNIIGKNNKIIINTDAIIGKLNLKIFGDNNYILIDENVSVSSGLFILIGKNHPNFGKVCNSKLEIHKDTSIESLEYITYNSNTFCVIEEQCMLSYGILIYNTDGHPIFDKDTGELLNKPRGITIGKHSWIGMKATILKNSIVPCNSIIACNAVYACGSRGGLIAYLQVIRQKLSKKILIGMQMATNMAI